MVPFKDKRVCPLILVPDPNFVFRPQVDTPTARRIFSDWEGGETKQIFSQRIISKTNQAPVVVVPDYLATPSQAGAGNPSHLTVRAGALFKNGQFLSLNVLIDTGAEINIIRRGLVSPDCFQLAQVPVRFLTASGAVLEGGQYDVGCTLKLDGRTTDTKLPGCANFSTTFYEADIKIDAILSLKWLSTYNVDVRSLQHGIMINSTQPAIWVRGLIPKPKTNVSFDPSLPPQQCNVIDTIDTTRMGPAQTRKKS